MSNNLDLSQIAATQLNKHTTANDQVAELDAALTEVASIAVDDSNATTLSSATFQRHVVFAIEEDATPPDEAITLTVPAIKRGLFVVRNNTDQPVTVEVSGQADASPAVVAGEVVLLLCDGAAVRAPGRIGDVSEVNEQTSLFSFYNASAQAQVHVDITASGQLVALRGATALGTTALDNPVFEDNVWAYLELEIFIHDSAGFIRVYRDGTQILNVENADTQNQADDVIATIRLWGCESGNAVSVVAYDDIYCTDDGARLGECRVSTLVPTGDTADADWTPLGAGDHFAEVDDDDGDSSYIASATPGDLDMFGLGDLPFTPTTIHAIQTTFRARKDDAATREIRAKIRSNGTTGDGATASLASSYLYYHDVFEQDPDTTAAWTATAVDALEAGVETVT